MRWLGVKPSRSGVQHLGRQSHVARGTAHGTGAIERRDNTGDGNRSSGDRDLNRPPRAEAAPGSGRDRRDEPGPSNGEVPGIRPGHLAAEFAQQLKAGVYQKLTSRSFGDVISSDGY